MKQEEKWRTFFLRVKKNNSCCSDPPPVIMTNGRKQNPDSYQCPCSYHDQGGCSSLLSLEDSKAMIQQKMETGTPGATGAQAGPRAHHVPMPGRLPKRSPSSSSMRHGGTCLTSHPREKSVQEIFLLSQRSWHVGTPPPFATGAQGTSRGSVFCLGRYGHLRGRVSSPGHSPCHRSSWSGGWRHLTPHCSAPARGSKRPPAPAAAPAGSRCSGWRCAGSPPWAGAGWDWWRCSAWGSRRPRWPCWAAAAPSWWRPYGGRRWWSSSCKPCRPTAGSDRPGGAR